MPETQTTDDYTPTEFAVELSKIIETRGDDSDEFKTRVKQLCNTARAKGLTESQIRTQLGAKADAMQATLEAEN